jgi:hypothetical protein
MKDPFVIAVWAIAIGIAWLMLASMTGIDDWLKGVFGRKESVATLTQRIDVLEKRLAQLEAKYSSAPSAK